jgi:LysR family cyn operon transcriptional activator
MHSKLFFPRSIHYLLSVAENQSFTRAAEALHVSQPTLSQQIKLLEEALDVQLLDRSGRTVRLTEAGEAYAHHARRAMDELDAAKRAVSELEDLSRGLLRLGMTPITEYLTTSLIDEFNARYPGIMVSAIEMAQDQIEEGVAEGTLDAGIAFTHMPATETWTNKIEMHTLFMEPLSLAVGTGHSLAGRQMPVSVGVLQEEPLVLLNQNFALRRHFDLYCLEHGIHPRIAVETNSLSMMVQSVGLGRLATVLPTTIACTQPGLYAVPLMPELPSHTIALIGPKGTYRSPACRAFGKLAAEWNFGRSPISPDHKLEAASAMLKPDRIRKPRHGDDGQTAPELSAIR